MSAHSQTKDEEALQALACFARARRLLHAHGIQPTERYENLPGLAFSVRNRYVSPGNVALDWSLSFLDPSWLVCVRLSFVDTTSAPMVEIARRGDLDGWRFCAMIHPQLGGSWVYAQAFANRFSEYRAPHPIRNVVPESRALQIVDAFAQYILTDP